MKKSLLISFIILISMSASFAALAIIPLEESVKESDLIIIGTLQEISETSYGEITKGKGKIVVHQFLTGNIRTSEGNALKIGDSLRLDYIEDFPCIMGFHKRMENKEGIFLLKVNDRGGEIQFKDFRSITELSKLNQLLEKEDKRLQPTKTIKLYEELKSKDYSLSAAIITTFFAFTLFCLLYQSKLRRIFLKERAL